SRRSDSTSVYSSRAESTASDAREQATPRRNWDRLTYGGIGGWFKRLFSSKKRAQHSREVQERRDAWAQAMENLNDGRSLPNLDLLKSKWAGKKLQSAHNELSRAGFVYGADDERLASSQRKLQRLMFLRDNVSAVHDEDVNPGPSAARRAPETGKGILKASSPASTSGPVAGDAEIDAQLQTSLSRSAGMEDAYESEQAAHDRVRALRDGAGDDESYEQARADYTAMTEATYDMEKRRERQSGVQAWKAQGDLAFPIRDVDRKYVGSREKALAFHQGYWKREQQAPAPTRKVGHDRRVRFDMGDQATERLLNTPGNMPNEGEAVSSNREGKPPEGRILPTGAYQYEAADP
ncbi:MAG: hypothetical protein EBZ67_17200, partial [Chitinophagia bacterium]|nr:hypothetical protein [Chitinophagia bacterium]